MVGSEASHSGGHVQLRIPGAHLATQFWDNPPLDSSQHFHASSSLFASTSPRRVMFARSSLVPRYRRWLLEVWITRSEKMHPVRVGGVKNPPRDRKPRHSVEHRDSSRCAVVRSIIVSGQDCIAFILLSSTSVLVTKPNPNPNCMWFMAVRFNITAVSLDVPGHLRVRSALHIRFTRYGI